MNNDPLIKLYSIFNISYILNLVWYSLCFRRGRPRPRPILQNRLPTPFVRHDRLLRHRRILLRHPETKTTVNVVRDYQAFRTLCVVRHRGHMGVCNGLFGRVFEMEWGWGHGVGEFRVVCGRIVCQTMQDFPSSVSYFNSIRLKITHVLSIQFKKVWQAINFLIKESKISYTNGTPKGENKPLYVASSKNSKPYLCTVDYGKFQNIIKNTPKNLHGPTLKINTNIKFIHLAQPLCTCSSPYSPYAWPCWPGATAAVWCHFSRSRCIHSPSTPSKHSSTIRYRLERLEYSWNSLLSIPAERNIGLCLSGF